jgi:ferritin-like metal-binding protein YciE
MLKTIDTPTELFTHKLGSALTMERTVLKMLGEMEGKAQHEEIKGLLRMHADETRQHVTNVEQAFAALGENADDKPCPAIDGLRVEGRANVELTDDALVDDVILAGAAETEHHEIAVYEELITFAETMGEPQVVNLLRQNLEQEQHALEEVQRAARAIAAETLVPAS